VSERPRRWDAAGPALRQHPSRRRWGCIPRALSLYGLFLLSTVAVWLLGGELLARWNARREERAWGETGRSMQALREQYPRTTDSEAARQLDGLTGRLGIRILRDPVHPSQIDDQAFYDTVNKYMSRLGDATDDRAVALPPEWRVFLDRHRSGLQAVAERLVSARDIVWETNIQAGISAPIPSLLAHRSLQSLLLMEALERQRSGDQTLARLFLEAAWRQSETLAARPELISRLIVVALRMYQHSVLRAMPEFDPVWSQRLAVSRLREANINTLQVEAHGWLMWTREYRGVADIQTDEPPGVLSGGPVAAVVRLLSVPYVHLSATSISRHLRRTRELSLMGDPCELDGEDVRQQVVRGIQRWELLARIVVPSTARVWMSGREADLDAEWTHLVLDTRQRMRQSGDWGVADRTQSKVCRAITWLRRRERAGGLTILADPAPPTERPHHWAFTLSPMRRQH
jgi:hypothetical protein